MAETQIIVSARDLASSTFRRIGLVSRGLTDKLFNLRNAMVGGVVYGLAQVVRGGIEATDQIGKVADKVGLTTDQLQELRYAADLAGVAQNQLDMGMQRFSRRLGEVAQGQGELLKTSKQYGVELRNSDGTMRSNIDLLGDWSNVIKNAESDQEALRIAFKLFDSEGAALVNMLRGGSAALDATREAAHDLGLVIDENLVRQSAKANDALTRLDFIVGTRFKATLAELAPDIVEVADNMADWVRENREFLTQDIPQYMRNVADGVGAIGTSIIEMKGSWDAMPEDLRNILLGSGAARYMLGPGGGMAFGGAYLFGKGVEGMTQWRKYLDENKDSWTWDVTGNWNKMFENMGLGASDDVKAVVEQLRAQHERVYDARVQMLMREQDDPRNLDLGSGIVAKPWQNASTSATTQAAQLSDQQIKLRENMTREIQRLTLDQYAFARKEAERTYQNDLAIAGKDEALVAQAGERRRVSLASIAEEEAKSNRQAAEQAAQVQRDLTAEIERATLGRYEAQRRETERYYDDLVKRAEKAGRETASIEQGRADRIAEINEAEREDAQRTAEAAVEAAKKSRTAWQVYAEDTVNGMQAQADMARTVYGGVESTITNTFTRGRISAMEFFNAVYAEMVKIQIAQPVAGALTSGIGSVLGSLFPSAKGNVLSGRGISSLSNGVYNSPTVFGFDRHYTKFAKGGVLAEAGPEGVFPLARTASGDLGVQAVGGNGGGGNVQVVIHNGTGQAVATRKSTDNYGNARVDVMIGDAAAKQLATPGTSLNRAVRTSTGAKQQVVRR